MCPALFNNGFIGDNNWHCWFHSDDRLAYKLHKSHSCAFPLEDYRGNFGSWGLYECPIGKTLNYFSR